ncbi:aminoacylase-1-like [Neodiprion virginianus]|uniref:N-acyl-aliphatic-L-amino acid amidohydrolase n=1 Tax=Neodiprion lecontei TaxID=441921 RepID=A0A6J0C322_NEOLC|nr:aminoacylase-1 [Neodiprion lecontei]XP_046594647.1 aminoacylase-1 [Neodiprion lecontei]XP_046617848.1 aminoacylase-1-like [Neodiprion virginianus]XP_046617849.1 aminoacylase-1-like [Neodiprion virginianus]
MTVDFTASDAAIRSAGHAMSSLYPKQSQLEATAVENFCEYLRIPTVQPNVNYDDCVAFLQKQAKSLDLPLKVYHVHPDKPIVIITWEGLKPSLPAILLNSHMDVVPVFADQWTYPPFSAHMDEKGNIYARGSQDMKCVGIQYLEAIRRLKLKGQCFNRTIHLSFVPDEEIGGVLGMREFVHTKDFQALNLGFALDEGVASPTNDFFLYNGERSLWHLWIYCPGNPGHGSLMLDNTAGEKIRIVIDKFMDFRAKEKAKLKDPKVKLGDVTSVNLTQLQGGIQTNVIPDQLVVAFDIRIAVTVDEKKFEDMVMGWCKEAGDDVHVKFEQKNEKIETTKVDSTNPFWVEFKKASDKLGVNLDIGIFPGATDSRFVRSVGIPAIGFSPMNNTPILLHDHNEYLNKDVFLRGVEIYTELIPAVANA